MEHPDTWRLLIDSSEKIVGYWHFVPLFDEEYELAKNGKLLDGEITNDRLAYLAVPGTYNMYFVSITILPEFRGVANFRLLLNSFLKQLSELAKDGIYFNEICTNAFTRAGESLCRTLGMSYQGTHSEKGRLYVLRMRPLPELRIFEDHPDLLRFYSQD